MTHAIMLFLGLTIFVLTRKMFYKNLELFICLLIPINFDFFHLLPRVGSFDNYREALLVIIFLHIIEFFFLRRAVIYEPSVKVNKSIGFVIIGFLLLLLVGGFTASFSGQPLNYSIMAMKWNLTILVFFLIVYREFDPYKFSKYLIILTAILAVLLISQYILYNHIQFFYFYKDSIFHPRGIESLRGLRLMEGVDLYGLCSVLSFSLFLLTRKKSYLGAFVLFIITTLVVTKVRAYILAIPVACTFIYFYYYGIRSRFIIFLFITLIIFPIFIVVLMQIPAVSEHPIVMSVQKDLSGVYSGSGNIGIRFLTYQYYFDEFLKEIWTGRGLISPNWPEGIKIYNSPYFISDIGMFHILVHFGLVGLTYVLYLFINSLRLFFQNRDMFLSFSYFILGAVLFMQIDIFFQSYQIFIFAIFIAISQKELFINSKAINKQSFT